RVRARGPPHVPRSFGRRPGGASGRSAGRSDRRALPAVVVGAVVDLLHVGVDGVVAVDGRVPVRRIGQVASARAQVVGRGGGRVVDVVRVRHAVAVAVGRPGLPGRGQELHRTLLAVLGADDGGQSGAVGGDAVAAGGAVVGLGGADAREGGPGQVAAGVLDAGDELGAPVGDQGPLGDAEVGQAPGPGAE